MPEALTLQRLDGRHGPPDFPCNVPGGTTFDQLADQDIAFFNR
jgi:hypothetical protein